MAEYRRCSLCIYYDICDHDKVCEYYDTDRMNPGTDLDTDRILKQGRIEFREEWKEYISQYNDDLFFN